MNGLGGTAMTPLGVVVNGHGGPDLLDDFEPQPRDRCNTWPMQKPAGDLGHHTSPLMHEEIPEEMDDDDLSSTDSTSCYQHQQNQTASVTFYTGGAGTNGSDHQSNLSFACHGSFQASNTSLSIPIADANSKKNTSRRNAWGNFSYADLITQAINSTAEKRMTLAQIYEWFLHEVPFFRDKGDSNSSAGWKNSIRHNLSLHSRFVRVQNEGAGKSSWWMLNPDAKPGKSSRRRTGSIEQPQAIKMLEKKRGRSKKKILDPTSRASVGNLQDLYPGSNACSSTSINRLGSPSIDSTSLGGPGIDFKTEFLDGVGAPPNAVLAFMPATNGGGLRNQQLMDFRARTDSSVSDYLPISVNKNSVGNGQMSPGGAGSLVDSASTTTTVEGATNGLFDDWDSFLPDRHGSLGPRDLIDTLSQSMTLGGAGGDPNGPGGAMPQSALPLHHHHHPYRLLVPPPPYQQRIGGGFGAGPAGCHDQPPMAGVETMERASPNQIPCLQQTRQVSDMKPNAAPVMNGFGGTQIKSEPPPSYQDLYPASGISNTNTNNNNGRTQPTNGSVVGAPMLRDALQQRLLSAAAGKADKRNQSNVSPKSASGGSNETTKSSSPDSSTSPAFTTFPTVTQPSHTTYLMPASSNQPSSSPPFLITNQPCGFPPSGAGRNQPLVSVDGGGGAGTGSGLTLINHHHYHPYGANPFGHQMVVAPHHHTAPYYHHPLHHHHHQHHHHQQLMNPMTSSFELDDIQVENKNDLVTVNIDEVMRQTLIRSGDTLDFNGI